MIQFRATDKLEIGEIVEVGYDEYSEEVVNARVIAEITQEDWRNFCKKQDPNYQKNRKRYEKERADLFYYIANED